MWPYFAIAIAASALVWSSSFSASRTPEKYQQAVTVAGYALAALVFCFFAGARDYSVGADVTTYGGPSFDAALSLGFTDFFSSGPYAQWGSLIKVALWASANATHSFFWYLFIIELIFVVPTLVAIRLLLKDADYMGIFIFGILFFPLSLNLMRQATAMGFVLLAFVFVKQRKPLLFTLFVVIGTLFHSTALVSLLIYPIWLLGRWDKGSLLVKTAIMGAIMAAAIFALPLTLEWLAPYLGYYGAYLTGSHEKSLGALKIALGSTLLLAGLGAIYWCCLRKSDPEAPRDPALEGMTLITFFGAALSGLGFVSAPLYRLGIYFLMLAVILVPAAITRLRMRPAKTIFEVACVLGLSAYSIGYYVLGSIIQMVLPYLLVSLQPDKATSA